MRVTRCDVLSGVGLMTVELQSKIKNKMASSINPDETARYELSYGSTLLTQVSFCLSGLKG